MKNKAELLQGAKEFFEADKNLKTILATADGQYFFPDKLNAATMHGREKGLKVYTLERNEVLVEQLKEKVTASIKAAVAGAEYTKPTESKTDYSKLKLAELQEEAAKRKLDTTGFEFKKHYIAALEAYDAKAAKAATEPTGESADGAAPADENTGKASEATPAEGGESTETN